MDLFSFSSSKDFQEDPLDDDEFPVMLRLQNMNKNTCIHNLKHVPEKEQVKERLKIKETEPSCGSVMGSC